MKKALVLLGLLSCGVAGFAAPSALTASHDAPPGATALCKDGTYSYSQTRSGTCSHHGGVADWLTLVTTTNAQPAAPTAPAAPSTGAVRVTLGKTVMLAPRTKSAGCRLSATPDRACSPGAYYSGLTKAVLCSPSFHTGTIRNVPESEKHAVEIEYGLAPRGYGSSLEIDHIVSLELGGSNDDSNLFPERAVVAGGAGYHAKDKLENRLHAMVCDGEITLVAAQQQIASNWQALYKRAFGVAATRRLVRHDVIPGGWKNCRAVNRTYRHGVGRAGAHDRTTGTPVTNFTHSTRLYNLATTYNRGLDRDHDGIACETA